MKKLLFCILVCLVLVGVAYYTQYRNARSTENRFTTSQIDYGEMRDVITGGAVLRPLDAKPVFSQISGQVVHVAPDADFREEVTEGQVLARLDQRDALLKLDEANDGLLAARAAVTAAEADLEKAKTARDEARHFADVASKSRNTGTVDQARAEMAVKVAEATIKPAQGAVEVAKARVAGAQKKVDQAELGLKLTTITVPYYGSADGKVNKPGTGTVQFDEQHRQPKRKFIVLERKVELGQNVDGKQPLFVLAPSLEDMRAHALIPESRIDRVAEGQKAIFWVDALGEDHKMPAEVAEIRFTPAQQQTGAVNFEVLLNVKNQKDPRTGEWQIRPGMTAPQIEITDRVHANVWKLPVNALSFTLDEYYQSPEAKQHAADMEGRLDMNLWTKIWILRDGKPWPVFVRVKGSSAAGEPGIKDAEFYEVLEWDPEMKAMLDPKNTATYPEVIIGAPPKSQGLFNLPKVNPFG